MERGFPGGGAGRPRRWSFQRLAIPDDVLAHLCSAIAQDRQGLLWFGTQRGLVRYDGDAFRVFRSSPAAPSTLAGSLTDPLTGLRNRRFLEQTIGADLELATRGHGDLVVLLADLDHFQSVNDTYGHAAGDAVLVQLAEVLRATFRASDYVVRWGGEDFLVVVRFVDRAAAAELAEKLRVAVAAHPFVLPDGTTLMRTCSIGFAVWPGMPAVPWERVVDLADGALYEAKRSGRNVVRAA